MKILAIDIGTANIKAVLVETKFKRFDIVLSDVTPVADALEPYQSENLLSPGQLTSLAAVKNAYANGVDRIVMNLPNSLYSSRFMTFPFADKRKVAAAVKFAIEDEIPFDVDECVTTSHVFANVSKKETHVLSGFAPTATLEKFLKELEDIHISPDVLLTEDSALSSQLQRSKSESLKCVAVLNLGHRKSGGFFFVNGNPVLHRNTMTGGFHVTEAIAKKYSIGMAEAELTKIDRSFLAVPGMALNKDQIVFSETIREALEPVFADFQQSVMAFNSRYNDQIDRIYVCGGTSLIPGLTEYLSDRWKSKVSHFAISDFYPNLTIKPQKSLEIMLPLATALGLSQAPGEAKSQINFRVGKLRSTQRGLQLNFKQFIYPAKLAFTLYIVAMLSLAGQIILLNREIDRKDLLLSKAFQGIFGKVSASFVSSMKVSPAKLKQAVAKKIEESQANGSSSTRTAVSATLELISDLSKTVPKTTVVEITKFDLQANQLSIQAESPNQAEAEKAISLLTKVPQFSNPKAGPIEDKGTRKKFSLSASIPIKKGT